MKWKNVGRLTLCDFMTFYKAMVINLVWYWPDRQIEQRNKIESKNRLTHVQSVDIHKVIVAIGNVKRQFCHYIVVEIKSLLSIQVEIDWKGIFWDDVLYLDSCLDECVYLSNLIKSVHLDVCFSLNFEKMQIVHKQWYQLFKILKHSKKSTYCLWNHTEILSRGKKA